MNIRPTRATSPEPLPRQVSSRELDSAIEEFRILENCLAHILQTAVRPRCGGTLQVNRVEKGQVRGQVDA